MNANGRAYIRAAENVFRGALADDEEAPPCFAEKFQDITLFRLFVQAMAEQCAAMDVLCQEGLFRPAHSILRCLLETAAMLVWISRSVPKRSKHFYDPERRKPNLKRVFGQIG